MRVWVPARSLCLVVGFLSITPLSFAEIGYTVRLLPEQKLLEVEMRIPVKAGASVVDLEIPKWAPGSYRYQDFVANVRDFAASTGTGQPLVVSHEEKTTRWSLAHGSSGDIVATYKLPADFADDVTHWSGPATYLYVAGRKEESCKLTIVQPSRWRTAVGLEPAGESFVAPSYDVLADNPVTAGQFIQDTYTVLGKPHFIVLRGTTKNETDRELLKRVCEHVTRAQADFFGGLPYNRYVWHFVTSDARDGGWGLEHLSSTQIGLATGLGPGIQKVISHEFFHLWNVKRTRSKPLGPFNYQELPQTGALWWLEGVTDYYAKLLLRRYGWQDDASFPGDLARTVDAVRRNEERLKISPYDASFRVREANNGRGNSRGLGIDYYGTGLLVGLCLDIELRSLTSSRRSLDDVTRALYDLTKDDRPGFDEDEIRKQLVRFGGESMGPFYDRLVMAPGELPIEEQLAKMGLQLSEVQQPFADFGITYSASKIKGGLEVREAKGPAEGKLLKDDLIVAVGGESLDGLSVMRMLRVADARLTKASAGTETRFRVKRASVSEPLEFVISPVAASRAIRTVLPMPNASEAALALRAAWLAAPATWKP